MRRMCTSIGISKSGARSLRKQGHYICPKISKIAFPRNAPRCDEIDCEAAQPMAAFVMFASYGCQPGAFVIDGSERDRRQAFVGFGKTRGDSFQHPGAT